MQKIVEHILFDQDKREFNIEHNLGIDRFSKDSIKKISYRKLPVGISELFDKNLFVKNGEVDFTTIIKKPLIIFLTYFIVILFGITLFKPVIKLIEVSNLFLFINGSDIDQTKGLLLMIALFLGVPFLIYYLFKIISKVIDFIFFGKIVRGDGFDFELKFYGKNVETYFYNHKEVSIYQVFIKQGIESIDKSISTSIIFGYSFFFKLLIFSCLAYVSLNLEFSFKNLFNFLNFDIDLLNYEIFIESNLNENQAQAAALISKKIESLSPLNSKIFYSINIILILVGICFFVLLFALVSNLFFLILSLFLGPFVLILNSVVDYVFEYLRAKKSKYSELTPLIPYSLTKLNVFFIVIMLVNWKLSNEFSYLPITLTICLIVIAIVNYIILLRFKSVIHYTNHIPISLYSNMYVAELICKNQRFDLLNKMNPVLFINNKYWVESKLIEGYKIMPYCDEKLSIQIDKHYYLDYVKNEKSDELQPLPNYFSNDKEFITELLNVNGLYLKYASRWLKSNVETVSLAVRLNGLALEFVDEPLKDNKEIVLLAVNSNGIALKFASQGLSLDKEVVLTALKSNKEAFAFIGNKLKNDEDILKYLN
jgi:hypothetical protein